MNSPTTPAAPSALAALKQRLSDRRDEMAGKLATARQNVVLAESQLKQVRAEADTAHGALQGLELALGDVEAALQKEKAVTPVSPTGVA